MKWLHIFWDPPATATTAIDSQETSSMVSPEPEPRRIYWEGDPEIDQTIL